jgi:hypothetical protein
MSEQESPQRPKSDAASEGPKRIRICETCGLDLHELATMRSIKDKRAITVHRCNTCNKVISSES